MKYEYDAAALAEAIVKRRRVKVRQTMREAATAAGVSLTVIYKAEAQARVSQKSFAKICSWLEIEPGEFFKESEK